MRATRADPLARLGAAARAPRLLIFNRIECLRVDDAAGAAGARAPRAVCKQFLGTGDLRRILDRVLGAPGGGDGDDARAAAPRRHPTVVCVRVAARRSGGRASRSKRRPPPPFSFSPMRAGTTAPTGRAIA